MADTQSPGGTPPATVTPAAPAASSSTVQKDFNSRVSEAKSPADIRRLTQEMVANSPKPGTQPKPVIQAPAPEPAAVEATPAAAEPEAVMPESGEATPAADAGAPEQQPEAAAPEAEPEVEDDGGEGPITPVTGKRAHLRLAEDDQVGRLAASFMKRNRDLPMSEAVAKAQAQLGIKPAVAAPEATPETPATSALPESTQETDSLIEQRFGEYEKAMSEVRFEDAAKINREILKLTVHRTTLERRAEQQEVQALQKYDADFDSALAKAVDLYPFAANPESPGYKRMMQLDAQYKSLGDPLFHRADKPFKLAQIVAAELNIAPRNKNAAPAKPAAAPVANGAPKKGVVPSGSGRTTPPAQNQPAVDPGVAGIKNMVDLRAQLKRFGVK